MTYQNSINNTLYTQANTPICGGTSDSGPVQSANGYGNSNWVLTDQGFGNLPAFAPSPAIISTNVQVFSPAGDYTYTPSTGVQFCLIEVIGGGGGGGASNTCSDGNIAVGGSAGGGGYSRLLTAIANIGTSASVTVGAGGAGGNSDGSYGFDGGQSEVSSDFIDLSGSGGSAGDGGSNSPLYTINGQRGGGASGGDLNVTGSPGENSWGIFQDDSNWVFTSGSGGSSFYGPGAASFGLAAGGDSSQQGSAGIGYGGGGNGGANQGGSFKIGGNGADGVVIITEYISQS